MDFCHSAAAVAVALDYSNNHSRDTNISTGVREGPEPGCVNPAIELRNLKSVPQSESSCPVLGLGPFGQTAGNILTLMATQHPYSDDAACARCRNTRGGGTKNSPRHATKKGGRGRGEEGEEPSDFGDISRVQTDRPTDDTCSEIKCIDMA